MPMWRCPHCATPQAETARCWVCHRSSTACGSCRHFRRSVAAQLGYCGLDRQRRPLTGDEIRECWESLEGAGSAATPARPTLGPAAGWALEPGEDRTPVRLRDFVEVRGAVAAGASVPGVAASTAFNGPGGESAEAEERAERPATSVLASATEPRWSLWGDAEA